LTPSKRLLSTKVPLQTFRPISTILSKPQPSQKSSSVQRIAAFHASISREILPPGPQVLHGGVNDAAPVPKPSPTHGSYHWTFERLISLGLVPLTIAPFASGTMNPTLDAIFVATILIHSHIGFQSLIIDYIPTHQHPTMRKTFGWLLNLATVVVGIGFYEFETNDVGLTEAIKRIWHAGANDVTIGAADINALGHDGKLKHLK